MKTMLTTLVAVAAVAFGQLATADGGMGQGQMMSGRSMPIMSQMQQHMQGMRSQMQRIHATRDPQERSQLMQEHMQSMRATLQMMGTMGQSTMPAGNSDGASMMQCADNTAQCRQMNHMAEQQQQMQQRMNMMQMMMQQMLDHEAAVQQDRSE